MDKNPSRGYVVLERMKIAIVFFFWEGRIAACGTIREIFSMRSTNEASNQNVLEETTVFRFMQCLVLLGRLQRSERNSLLIALCVRVCAEGCRVVQTDLLPVSRNVIEMLQLWHTFSKSMRDEACIAYGTAQDS